jgi:hypothetical protein
MKKSAKKNESTEEESLPKHDAGKAKDDFRDYTI